MSNITHIADYQRTSHASAVAGSQLQPGSLLEFEYDVTDYPFGGTSRPRVLLAFDARLAAERILPVGRDVRPRHSPVLTDI
jgi:hypothetical protein